MGDLQLRALFMGIREQEQGPEWHSYWDIANTHHQNETVQRSSCSRSGISVGVSPRPYPSCRIRYQDHLESGGYTSVCLPWGLCLTDENSPLCTSVSLIC